MVKKFGSLEKKYTKTLFEITKKKSNFFSRKYQQFINNKTYT